MFKIALTTVLASLFLFSSALADCPKEAITIYDSDGDIVTCIPLMQEVPDWLLKLPVDPTPQPMWKEEIKKKLEKIISQEEASKIIEDIELLAAMNALANYLSRDLQKSMHLEIDSIANKIFPEELVVKFSNY
jgi:hypothetical protein